jgi:hypothetical protein
MERVVVDKSRICFEKELLHWQPWSAFEQLNRSDYKESAKSKSDMLVENKSTL